MENGTELTETQQLDVALDALGVEREAFEAFYAEAQNDPGMSDLTRQDLVVHMHAMNVCMAYAEQTGEDVDQVWEQLVGDNDLTLNIEYDGEAYEVTVEFIKPEGDADQ